MPLKLFSRKKNQQNQANGRLDMVQPPSAGRRFFKSGHKHNQSWSEPSMPTTLTLPDAKMDASSKRSSFLIRSRNRHSDLGLSGAATSHPYAFGNSSSTIASSVNPTETNDYPFNKEVDEDCLRPAKERLQSLFDPNGAEGASEYERSSVIRHPHNRNTFQRASSSTPALNTELNDSEGNLFWPDSEDDDDDDNGSIMPSPVLPNGEFSKMSQPNSVRSVQPPPNERFLNTNNNRSNTQIAKSHDSNTLPVAAVSDASFVFETKPPITTLAPLPAHTAAPAKSCLKSSRGEMVGSGLVGIAEAISESSTSNPSPTINNFEQPFIQQQGILHPRQSPPSQPNMQAKGHSPAPSTTLDDFADPFYSLISRLSSDEIELPTNVHDQRQMPTDSTHNIENVDDKVISVVESISSSGSTSSRDSDSDSNSGSDSENPNIKNNTTRYHPDPQSNSQDEHDHSLDTVPALISPQDSTPYSSGSGLGPESASSASNSSVSPPDEHIKPQLAPISITDAYNSSSEGPVANSPLAFDFDIDHDKDYEPKPIQPNYPRRKPRQFVKHQNPGNVYTRQSSVNGPKTISTIDIMKSRRAGIYNNASYMSNEPVFEPSGQAENPMSPSVTSQDDIETISSRSVELDPLAEDADAEDLKKDREEAIVLRRRQQQHLASYRQSMIKITGSSNTGEYSRTLESFENHEDESDNVPLAIIQEQQQKRYSVASKLDMLNDNRLPLNKQKRNSISAGSKLNTFSDAYDPKRSSYLNIDNSMKNANKRSSLGSKLDLYAPPQAQYDSRSPKRQSPHSREQSVEYDYNNNLSSGKRTPAPRMGTSPVNVDGSNGDAAESGRGLMGIIVKEQDEKTKVRNSIYRVAVRKSGGGVPASEPVPSNYNNNNNNARHDSFNALNSNTGSGNHTRSDSFNALNASTGSGNHTRSDSFNALNASTGSGNHTGSDSFNALNASTGSGGSGSSGSGNENGGSNQMQNLIQMQMQLQMLQIQQLTNNQIQNALQSQQSMASMPQMNGMPSTLSMSMPAQNMPAPQPSTIPMNSMTPIPMVQTPMTPIPMTQTPMTPIPMISQPAPMSYQLQPTSGQMMVPNPNSAPQVVQVAQAAQPQPVQPSYPMAMSGYSSNSYQQPQGYTPSIAPSERSVVSHASKRYSRQQMHYNQPPAQQYGLNQQHSFYLNTGHQYGSQQHLHSQSSGRFSPASYQHYDSRSLYSRQQSPQITSPVPQHPRSEHNMSLVKEYNRSSVQGRPRGQSFAATSMNGVATINEDEELNNIAQQKSVLKKKWAQRKSILI